MSLIDKIRAAREISVEANGHKFTIRRPTDEEAVRFSAEKIDLVNVVKRFTTGWDLHEIDLISSGSSVPVPFDPELFAEWAADNPEIWEPLGKAIMDAYTVHASKREAAAKN
jgi:hypothetical protein